MQIILKPLGAALVAGAIVTLSVTLLLLNKNTPTAPTVAQKLVETQGQVGVGTWVTEAEFEDIRLNDQPVELVPELGKWDVTGASHLHQKDTAGDKMLGPAFLAVGGSPTASNYTLTLRARKLSGNEGFLIPFYVRSKTDYFWWNLGGWGNTEYQIERSVGGTKSSLVQPKYMGTIEMNRWYAIKLECKGTHIKAYLDDKLIHDVTIP